jgi:hypothetical protein
MGGSGENHNENRYGVEDNDHDLVQGILAARPGEQPDPKQGISQVEKNVRANQIEGIQIEGVIKSN